MLKSLFRKQGAATEEPAAPAATTPQPEPAKARRVLRIGLLSAVGELDPAKVRDSATSLVLAQVFEPLYDVLDAAKGLTPILASGPPRPLDASGKKFAIPLRDDIAFSDGTPMTAESVAASLARQHGFMAQGEVTVSGGELHVSLHTPNPNFALFLTQTACGIVLPREGRLLGTGPFLLPEGTVEEVRAAEEVVLARNPKDRDAAATGIDELRVKRFGSAAELAQALADGSVHYTDGLPVGTEVAAKNVYPITKTGNSTGILFVNTERVRDPKARAAILKAVSRGEVAQRSFDSMSIAYVTARLLPTVLGDEGVAFGESDSATAKRLLGEAAKAPQKLTMLVTWGPKAYMPRPKEAAEMIRVQIAAALGIPVDVVHPTRDEYYKRQRAGDYDLILGGWIPDTPDPRDFYESLLASSAIPGIANATSSGNNLSRWADARTDQLLEELRADPSLGSRTALVKHVADAAVLTPLLLGKFVAYVSWDVKAVKLSALGRAHFRGATVHPKE